MHIKDYVFFINKNNNKKDSKRINVSDNEIRSSNSIFEISKLNISEKKKISLTIGSKYKNHPR